MDYAEAQRRDRVLRCWFEGRDWSKSPEYQLARSLVMEPPEILQEFAFVVDYEWEVVEGFSQLGRGDLVFTDGLASYAVVEVKYVEGGRWGGSGRNRRNHMREKRRKVEEQAWTYAHAWLRQHPDARSVSLFLLTNVYGLHPYGKVEPETADCPADSDNVSGQREGEGVGEE